MVKRYKPKYLDMASARLASRFYVSPGQFKTHQPTMYQKLYAANLIDYYFPKLEEYIEPSVLLKRAAAFANVNALFASDVKLYRHLQQRNLLELAFGETSVYTLDS